MASLLDRIQQLGSEGPQPQQRGIEKVLRQKTGKAAPRRGPAATALGEQAAIGAGQQALREQTFAERLAGVQARTQEQALAEQQALSEQRLRQQEQLQQERLAAETAATRETLQAREEEARIRREAGAEQQIKNLNNQAEQRLRDLSSQRNMTLDNLFSQYEFDTAELEDRRDASQLEQQAFLMAMQDRKYLEELDKIGKQRQLENDIAFTNEMNRVIFGDRLDNLLDDLDFKRGRAATGRDYTRQLAEIDFDIALQMSRAAVRDEAERTKWQAIGTVGGIAAAEVAKGEEGIFAEKKEK